MLIFVLRRTILSKSNIPVSPAPERPVAGPAEMGQQATKGVKPLRGTPRPKRPRKRKECHIDLTDDCLSLIFHRVDWRDRLRAERVCRRWRNVVLASGWSRFHEFNGGALGQLAGGGIQTLLTRFGSTLRELVLNVYLEQLDIRAALDHCPSVAHLSLRVCRAECKDDFSLGDCIPPVMRERLITLELHGLEVNFSSTASFPS